MRSFFRVMLAVMVIASVALPALAQDEGGKTEKKEKMEMKKAGIPEGYTAQKTCPVMGGKITKKDHVDYQGQRIYFCCAGCEKTFLEDPDKYFEKAAEDKVMFENVQTTCPVTGEPIDREVFTYYKGRRIFFCCENCMKKFEDDPGKYLDAMKEGGAKEKCGGHTGKETGKEGCMDSARKHGCGGAESKAGCGGRSGDHGERGRDSKD